MRAAIVGTIVAYAKPGLMKSLATSRSGDWRNRHLHVHPTTHDDGNKKTYRIVRPGRSVGLFVSWQGMGERFPDVCKGKQSTRSDVQVPFGSVLIHEVKSFIANHSR